MRALFLALSNSKIMSWLCAHFAPARRLVRRFTAGESLDDALVVVRQLNSEGKKASLNYLGEKVVRAEDARRVTDYYKEILDRIREEGVEATISIKPSHMGLELGEDVFFRNLESVLNKAVQLDNTVEVDMEDSSTTSATLEIFHRLLDQNANLRIALQTALFRTGDDLDALARRKCGVRLVKGAYDESGDVAWKSKNDVDASFSSLIEKSFAPEAMASGFHPAFGTHDHHLIEKVFSEALKQRVSKDRFEFQMLLGIRRDWQKKLVDSGYALRIYVPFGSHWYPYFMRRVAERPANALFMIRAMLSR